MYSKVSCRNDTHVFLNQFFILYTSYIYFYIYYSTLSYSSSYTFYFVSAGSVLGKYCIFFFVLAGHFCQMSLTRSRAPRMRKSTASIYDHPIPRAVRVLLFCRIIKQIYTEIFCTKFDQRWPRISS